MNCPITDCRFICRGGRGRGRSGRGPSDWHEDRYHSDGFSSHALGSAELVVWHVSLGVKNEMPRIVLSKTLKPWNFYPKLPRDSAICGRK